MDLLDGAPERARVEEFGRRHHTGLVTVVFTDLVDSVALRRQLGDQAATTLLESHRRIVRELLKRAADAEEIETAGDSFLLLFARPSDAVKFALVLQQQTGASAKERKVALAVRIGIHVGEVVIQEHAQGPKPKDLHGSQVDVCARVMSLARGGQILLTRAVFDSARQALKGEEVRGLNELQWLDHGPYVLKGIEEPVDICEVGDVGAGVLKAPTDSDKAQRRVRAGEEPVFGWRPAVGQVVPNTRWLLEQKLGEGGFGEVWLGRHQMMKEWRVFKFCFRAERVRFLKREMTLFRLLKERVGDHPNIVRLHDMYLEQAPFYVEMDYVEGQDLRTWTQGLGGVASVPLETRLEIVAQIADGLQAAHAAGVIHRDIKPTNILVGKGLPHLASGKPVPAEGSGAVAEGSVHAKLTDFGIGQVVSEEYLAGMTRAGFTQTIMSDSSTSRTGTQMYMAPELLAGKPASIRSDVYSLGVVLYQLVIADLTQPLTTDWTQSISDPILVDDLKHCFAGNPQDRFADAGQLARNLRALPQRRAAFREHQVAAAAQQRTARRLKLIGLAGAAVLVAALGLSLAWSVKRNSKVRWAREVALPQINQLIAEDRTAAAFALAREAERYIPSDPALTNLVGQVSVRTWIQTRPPGADVYYKDYRQPDSPWEYLGRSPLSGIRLPSALLRFQIKRAGYEPLDRAASPRWDATNVFTLSPAGSLPPRTVRIEDGAAGLIHLPEVKLGDYLVDKFEVSNGEFKEFIDRGGYSTTNHWKHAIVKEGKALTWTEAMAEFRDTTGQPGPSTWKNGTYREGQADYPVSGVSWYEAAAYADFVGKRLPSIYHWSAAACFWYGEFVPPLNNFAGRGPAPVGSYPGISWCGAYDMAGNIKEWCWNEAGQGKRYILGGGWQEPPYMFSAPDAQPPLNRSPLFGFRCIQVLSNAPPQGVDDPVAPAFRDYTKEQPVNDQTFEYYRRQFIYDKTDLNARTEGSGDPSDLCLKEKISFNAAYGNERVTAYLFLPRRSSPPFQTVVYFPGSDAIDERSSSDLLLSLSLRDTGTSILEQGRALMYPIYKGTFERGDSLRADYPMTTSLYHDHLVQWYKDLARAIDYLETRPDIRHDKLAYCGLSWGAALGAILPAIENRFKASVLVGGGFCMESALREVDQINFTPRVTVPTLMINGRFDFFCPVETSQEPMFRLLGTAPEHKRHAVLDCGHVAPKAQIAREMQDWLDRYLGPVR
jgi:class 3 adenylate cyclase/cephalosporin-C deacetylase-like acetyl esterase